MQNVKKSVVKWIKEPSNALLVAIVLAAFAVHLYYLATTNGQALWWDEAEYGSMAKFFIHQIPSFNLNPQRPFLFSGIISVLLLLHIPEQIIKVLVTAVPSAALVACVYLLGKEMYNSRIALIAAFLTAVSWTFVFWSSRLQPDFLSMCFQVLAIFFIWRYWKEDKPRLKLIILSAVAAALAFQFKVSGLLVPASIFVFMLVRDRLSMIKNKHYWIFAGAFIIALLPQFIYSYIAFGSPLTFLTGSGYAAAVVNDPHPVAWYTFGFYQSLTTTVFFILFLAGIVLSLEFLLYLDVLVKDKKKMLNADLFGLVVLAVVTAFYVFYIRGVEDRWIFLWLPFVFFFIGRALMFLYGLVKPYSKEFAFVLVLALLAFGAYTNITQADALIKVKKDSYLPTKMAGEWLKENANHSDRILSASYTQTAYYSEINVTHLTGEFDTPEKFDAFVNATQPRYIMLSAFEFNPQGAFQWVQQNSNRLSVAKAYFSDAERKNPVLIIYEVKSPQ